MLKIKIIAAALVLSVATANAAFAREPASYADAQAGVHGNAQAIDRALQAIGPRLAANAERRMRALHQCNKEAAPLKNDTWGSAQTDRYRACMAEHGQRA
ncbi:hypothetical protein [Rhodoplanes sp. Z2-YC6860]|uniref:hypothetical protein n=1 Tax=Rhodoplanes sp. Z2-YC6860 TaxID=674703 RepID=UPI0008341FB8|nr:hypothetical protein [Rhodoplanes sp. Z2-YC6860]